MRYYIYISLVAFLSVLCFNNAMGQTPGVSPFGANRPQDTSKTKGQIVATAYANPNPAMFVRFDSKGHMVMAVPSGGGSGSVDSVTISNDSLFYWGGGVSFFVGIVNSGGSIDTTGLSDRINYNLTRINALSDSVGANRDSINVHRTAIDGKEPSITPGTTDQYWQGDKTWQAKSGLPISTATQAALDGKISYSDTTTIIASQDYVNDAIADIPIIDSSRYVLYSDTARSGSVATYPYVDSLFNEVPPLVDSSRYVLYGDSNIVYVTPTQLDERVLIYDVDSFGAIPNDDLDDSGPIQDAIIAWYNGGKKGKVVGWGIYDLKNTPTLNIPYPWDSVNTYIQQGQLYLPLSRETDTSKGVLEFCPRYSGSITFNGDGTYPKSTFVIRSTEGTYSPGQYIFQTSGSTVYNANTLYIHDVVFLLKNRGTNPVRMGCVSNTRGNLIAERCFFGVDTVYTALIEPTTPNNFGIRGSNNRDSIGWCINRISDCFSYGLYSGYSISANTYATGNTSAYCLIGITGTNNSGSAALQIPMHYNKSCKYDLAGDGHPGVDSCIMNIGVLNCDVDTNSAAWYKNTYTIWDNQNALTGDVHYNITMRRNRRNDLFAKLGGSWVRTYAFGEPAITSGFGVDITNGAASIEVKVDTADLETMFFKNYGNSFGNDFKLGNLVWDQFIYADGNGDFIFNNGSGPGWMFHFVQNNQDTVMTINKDNELLVGSVANSPVDAGSYKLQVQGNVYIRDSIFIANPLKAATKDTILAWQSGKVYAIPKPAGGSADSTTFFTNYRADTMRTNIYGAISAGGLQWSDTNVVATKYDIDTVNAKIPDISGFISWTDTVSDIATKHDVDTLATSIYAAGYLPSATAASTYVSLSGSYSNPTWITALAWSKITSTPTTLSGYGITDAVPNTRTVNGSPLSSDVTISTITGNAGTATALQTGRTIDNVTFDGTANIKLNRVWQGKLAGETDTLTTGVKLTFRMPYACTITGAKAAVNTASSSGNITIDIHENGNTIMSTDKITIEATETTSLDATQQPVLTDTSIAADALMEVEVDVAGTNAISGEVTIYYTLQ